MTSMKSTILALGMAMIALNPAPMYEGPTLVSNPTSRKKRTKICRGSHARTLSHKEIEAPKIGRNTICNCGSGKKYKYCCLK